MELGLIDWLRQHLPPHPRLRLGIGDDAAVLWMAERGECVVTVDMLTDGVDFHVGQTDPRQIGRKSLAVNLSDLAAMAARPIAAVVAIALPHDGALELAQALYDGMLPLAEEFDLAIAGGDTNTWDGPLVVSVTALGEPAEEGLLCRSGARPGDAIVVTGRLGGSILGHHLDFTPRVREAMILQSQFRLHAGIDISDGLSLDLWRMTQASGCGAVLDLARVPISDDARTLAASRDDGLTPLDHALSDGEDFELLLAMPEDEAGRLAQENPLDVAVSRIGTFVAERGLWQETPAGNRMPLEPRGWRHGGS